MSHEPLTREEYDLIRAAVDARARERVVRADAGCVGCGGDLDNYTTGCSRCWDRARVRRLRKDPASQEWMRRKWREAAARKRARRREQAAA